jgi:hypothetical protein
MNISERSIRVRRLLREDTPDQHYAAHMEIAKTHLVLGGGNKVIDFCKHCNNREFKAPYDPAEIYDHVRSKHSSEIGDWARPHYTSPPNVPFKRNDQKLDLF